VYIWFHSIQFWNGQFCTIYFISILIPFSYTLTSLHSHIHIPIQSTITKKNKKVLYSGVLNWVSKIVNYFSGFELRKKKKKKEYLNPHKPVPIRATRGLVGWPFTMWVTDLDFQTRSLRGGLWETCKSGPIRPAPTPTLELYTHNFSSPKITPFTSFLSRRQKFFLSKNHTPSPLFSPKGSQTSSNNFSSSLTFLPSATIIRSSFFFFFFFFFFPFFFLCWLE
jgi:hypothetical protein